jgi:hypothetical protein
MRRLAIWMTVAGAMLTTLPAYAVPITPSPTLISGDKRFDNFSCSSTGPGGLPCGSIDVASYTSSQVPDGVAGEHGIRITGAFNARPGERNDTTIEYEAHIVGGGNLFSDATMFFNGTPVSSIAEDIFDLVTGDLIGHLFVSTPGGPFRTHIDLAANVTDIRVVKDIQYIGDSAQGTISIVDQTFSQTIPEPTSLLLLGSGLVTLGLLRRRRRAA